MATKSKMTTDHEQIRRWAEERGGQPAEVERTERDGDTGMIRIDFPGYSGEGSLKPISWDEWFDKFDRSNLALVYQETTARGQRSNFNKLIGRETAEARAAGETGASRRSLRGRGRSARGSAGARSRRAAGTRRTGTASRKRKAATGAKSTRGGNRTREAPRAAVARLTGRGSTSRSAKRSSTGRGAKSRTSGAKRAGRKGTARRSASRTSRGTTGRGRRR